MPKICLLFLFVCLCGCVSKYPQRASVEPLKTPLMVNDLRNEWNQKMLDTRSIETFRVTHNEDTNDKEATTAQTAEIDKFAVTDLFHIGIIEFNDEGWGNLIQQEQVFAMIRSVNEKAKAQAKKEAEKNGTESTDAPLIITFIHGWHHNANVCDGNLACFREVLNTIANFEKNKGLRKKPVIGIFVGWRGEAAKDPLGKVLSIWNRKNTAIHIGKTGGKDFLLRLEDLVDNLKVDGGWDQDRVPTMVTIGHSLGGALLFSAIQQDLIGTINGGERYIRSKDEYTTEYKPSRSGFGDLCVLVNPAIDAYEYIPFQKDIEEDNPFLKNQLPILVSVASDKDSAVGWAFPAAYLVGSLIQPWDFAHPFTKSRGIGHYKAQRTHYLSLPEKDNSKLNEEEQDEQKSIEKEKKRKEKERQENASKYCGCGYGYPNLLRQAQTAAEAIKLNALGTSSTEEANESLLFAPGIRTKADESGLLEKKIDLSKDENQFGDLILRKVANIKDPNVPYLVIGTDGKVIGGHNDIYNEHFVGFLLKFMLSFQKERENLARQMKTINTSGPNNTEATAGDVGQTGK